MIIRRALLADLLAIEAMRRRDGNALGFIPIQRYRSVIEMIPQDGRSRWRYERLLVAEDNGEVTGFIYAGLHTAGLKIEQVCVREDARRMERALGLVDVLECEAMLWRLPRGRCRVGYDLEANSFWLAASWQPVGRVVSTWLNQRESKCRQPLIVYDKVLCQPGLF